MLTTRGLTLLRIFLGEADKADGRPLYEALVIKARALHLAGATVLRGPMGFGHASRLHTSKILRLSHDLPMIVEIVDERAKLIAFLEAVAPLMGHAIATLQPVEVVSFSPAQPQP
jgi:PII-like signaling protein